METDMTRILLIIVASAIASAALVLLVSDLQHASAQSETVRGEYQVAGGEHPILSTAGGKTWVLVTSKNPQMNAWFPVTRLDSEADIRKWMITSKLQE